MIEEARDELASVPEELRTTLPFITACINYCTHFQWWDQAADLGLEALARWPERDDIREVTARCLVNAGRRSEVLQLLLGILNRPPSPNRRRSMN